MKKIILLIAILLSTKALFSTEKTYQSQNYVGIEGGYPNLVTLSLGHKHQWHHHGFDTGIGFTPITIFLDKGHIYGHYPLLSQP